MLYTHTYDNNTYIPKILNEWKVTSASFLMNTSLYSNTPEVIYNFNLGSFTYGPYANLNSMHGIELLLILEYCKQHQLFLNITDYPDDKWGEYNTNYTGIGILGGVIEGFLQAGISGFYLNGGKLDYVDQVGPTVRIGNTCLVPSPRIATGLLSPLLNFKTEVWFGILITVPVFILLWKLIDKYFYRNRYPLTSIWITVFGIFVQQFIPIVPKPGLKHIRKIIFILLFFSLIITVAYTSKLYSIMTSPRFTDAVETIDDLEKSGLLWGASHITYAGPIADAHPKLLSNFIVDNEPGLVKRMLRGNFAILIEHLTRGYVVRSRITATDVRMFNVMDRDIYWIYGAIMIPKSSVFQPTLLKHMLYSREAGMIYRWEQQAFLESGSEIQIALKEIEIQINVPMHLAQMQGIFMIWFLGVTSALAVFIYEILFTQKCN